MKVGQVIGRVVLSACVPEYRGGRWLLVNPLHCRELSDPSGNARSEDPTPVVYDSLGAAPGDRIGYTEGGEATLPFDFPMPIDAYNCCIFDRVHLYPEFQHRSHS